MNQEILTTAEAAELLRLSIYAVRELARHGKIPAKKLGKEWRFYRPDLVAFLRGREAKD